MDEHKLHKCSFMVQNKGVIALFMKKTAFLFAALALLVIVETPAFADACSARARQVAASLNADVISVQSSTGANGQLVCVARLKINSPGKPSRIVTRRFRP